MFLRIAASLTGGIVIGMVFSVKLTLVFMAFVPFIAAFGFLDVLLMKGNAKANQEALETAGKASVTLDSFHIL